MARWNMMYNIARPKSGLNLVLVITGLFWFGAVSLRAMDRYVVEPGTIDPAVSALPYNAWTNAATNIQWAVDAATNVNDTVWVSNGTYVLTNQIVVTNAIILRSASGPTNTIVNGGFVFGAENATTNNRCLYLSNLSALVSGFTFSNGAVCSTGGAGAWIGGGILSNCTVRDNIAFTLPNAAARVPGGGIYLNPRGTVTACRVTGNIVTNETFALKSYGGGIYGGSSTDSPGWEVYGCVVSNNRIVGVASGTAKRGGGIYVAAGKVRSSLICNNATTDGYGGGVSLRYGGVLSSCTISVNQAYLGGGIFIQGGITTNCLVSSNWGSVANSSIGGIYCAPNNVIGAEVYNTTVSGHTNTAYIIAAYEAVIHTTNKMINCTIENNDALGLDLSGTTTNYSIFMVSNCVVRNNKKGGIRCADVRDVQIRNCLIANNTNSESWAGLWIGYSARTGTVLVSGCTIVSNWGMNYGAGIRFADTNGGITVSSCVIASNGVGATCDVYDACAPTNYNALQYSCVGWNPGFTGAAIIVADPMFENFAGGNYRLNVKSPCVNTGSNEPWMNNTFDLDGRMRIRYGTVDMGAFETLYKGVVYSFR